MTDSGKLRDGRDGVLYYFQLKDLVNDRGVRQNPLDLRRLAPVTNPLCSGHWKHTISTYQLSCGKHVPEVRKKMRSFI